MKSRGFASGALILAMGGMIAKLLGAIYRIPLTNILGAEGIGNYQLVFPLFALLLALSCNALPVAVSRMVASDRARGLDHGIKNTMGASLLFALLTGVVSMIAMLTIAPYLAKVQGVEGLEICYRILAPTIVIVAIGGVFKGWFLGMSDTLPCAATQPIEQIVKLVVGILLAKLLLPRGIIWGVAGALAGVAVSELVGLITLAVWYAVSRISSKGISLVDPAFGLYRLTKIATPVTLSSLVFPIVTFVDSILIVKVLTYSGVDGAMAVTQYGLLTGPVSTLINMPVVIALSLAVAIVPAVSSHLATYDVEAIKQKTALSIKLSYLIGVPCMAGLWVLASPVLKLLYPAMSELESELSVRLLRVQTPVVVLLSQLEVFNATLQGLDKAPSVVLNVAIGGLVKIALEILLIYRLGIVGASVALVIFYALSGVLDMVLYQKLVGKNTQLVKSIGKILLSSAIMTVAIAYLPKLISSPLAATVVVTAVGVVVYFVAVALLRVLSSEEVKRLPLPSKLRKRKCEKI
ncbi:MAG: oligosaccharide flippase family protein [Christensenellales bacterium]